MDNLFHLLLYHRLFIQQLCPHSEKSQIALGGAFPDLSNVDNLWQFYLTDGTSYPPVIWEV